MAEKLDERVRIVREVKRALERQRDRLLDYLKVLDLQRTDILADDTVRLVRHAEVERALLQEISVLERVCVPLEQLYNARCAPAGDSVVPELRGTLGRLRSRALDGVARNRQLLEERMGQLRREIASLRILIPRRSPFAAIGEAALVDIRT